MRILRTPEEIQLWKNEITPGSLGFVPTMGALHAGHLSLLDASKRACQKSIVSIFVNPLQFGPSEDLSKYPRTFDEDCEQLKDRGCDAVYAPSVEIMYPQGASTFVYETQVTKRLEGAFRPGHFQGVATVVTKLFNQVAPSHVFFGQKDAQQCALIERMIRDLNFPLTLKICPTLRESDGLAMSSRNRYLSPAEREQASQIFKSFGHIRSLIRDGIRDPRPLEEAARKYLGQHSPIQTQYYELVDPRTFEPAQQLPARAVFAGFIGQTRLIDNDWIEI